MNVVESMDVFLLLYLVLQLKTNYSEFLLRQKIHS